MLWRRTLKNSTAVLMVASIILLAVGSFRNDSRVQPHASLNLFQSIRIGHKRLFQDTKLCGRSDAILACPMLPHELGLVGEIPVNLTAPNWEELDAMYPDIEPGGLWSPSDCVARSRVAIVVPYRDRDENLRSFLQHMHAFLQKQKLQYGIIVAEQAGNTSFNRGIMRNIGFQEANLNNEYDCTTFNDVDLLPENDMNSYGCSDMPRHMCIALDYFDYKPIASGAVFGGIVSFRNDHFVGVNGYSNLYFGWGGEDDDIMTRCRKTGVGFYRARPQYGRYRGTPHKKDHRVKFTYRLWRWRAGRTEVDGLNSLQYKLLKREKRSLYTWVLAEVNEEKYIKEADAYLFQMEQQAHNSTKQQTQMDDSNEFQSEARLSDKFQNKAQSKNKTRRKTRLSDKPSRQEIINQLRKKGAGKSSR